MGNHPLAFASSNPARLLGCYKQMKGNVMAVKAKAKGVTGHVADILAAAANYGCENPTVLLAGTAAGMPIVVAHTTTYSGKTTFRFQTFYKPYGSDTLRPGYGLIVPVEHREALIAAIKAM